MGNLLKYVIIAVALSACAAIDHSESLRMSHLVGKEFKLEQNSFLYPSDTCADIDQKFFSDFESCTFIQVAGDCLPRSIESYRANPSLANSTLTKCRKDKGAGWFTTSKITGHIQKDAIIRIEKVAEHPYGAGDRFWVIGTTILSGQLIGYRSISCQSFRSRTFMVPANTRPSRRAASKARDAYFSVNVSFYSRATV